MRQNTSAAPARVFEVLSNGWSYPSWVVGSSRVRDVDPGWPAVGSRLHHSFGMWPAVIDDELVVLANEAPHRLVLQAKGRPVGEATVDLRIDAWGTGSMITVTEDATRGPGLLVPGFVRQRLLGLRNVETLRRLVWLAERNTDRAEGTHDE